MKQKVNNDEIFDSLLRIKENLHLDLDIENFDNKCFMVNYILTNHGLYLRIYELRDKSRYLPMKNTNKSNIVSCWAEL